MSKKRIFEGRVLTEERSEDWEFFLETASVFNYLNMEEITLVCPVPGKKGTLVLQNHLPYLAEEKPLDMIEKFFATHRLMDYHLMRQTCKSLAGFPSQKVPIVNAHFALFPVTKPEEAIWLNPFSIFQVVEENGWCSVLLTNGLTLDIPIIKQSFIRLACKAVYSLATYRQDYSLRLLTNGQPLNYVALPATPFGQTLSRQGILQKWLLTPGEFANQYKQEEHLHWYRELEDFSGLLV
ncbi:competence protein ComK [Enterococcus sp. AZ163]|uniref:competence protein ComK n=1 Tax=Enterococcus sp. AZ163 TaxID=2774638 RepID=UPI003D2A3808